MALYDFLLQLIGLAIPIIKRAILTQKNDAPKIQGVKSKIPPIDFRLSYLLLDYQNVFSDFQSHITLPFLGGEIQV